jgi:hypothetical protein
MSDGAQVQTVPAERLKHSAIAAMIDRACMNMVSPNKKSQTR